MIEDQRICPFCYASLPADAGECPNCALVLSDEKPKETVKAAEPSRPFPVGRLLAMMLVLGLVYFALRPPGNGPPPGLATFTAQAQAAATEQALQIRGTATVQARAAATEQALQIRGTATA